MISSSIQKYFTNSRQVASKESFFKIIYTIRRMGDRIENLWTGEALAIPQFMSELCVQKQDG